MNSPVICIGAALVDELYFCEENAQAATSNPATLKKSAGGVARNIALHLSLLGIPVQLITVLGNDPDGEWLKNECKKSGIDTGAILWVNDHTGKYASILNKDGSLFTAASTDPCSKYLSPEYLCQQEDLLSSASMIIADTNLNKATIEWLVSFCKTKNIPLLIEPVSIEKASKLSAIDLSGVFMITPNEDELASLSLNNHENKDAAVKELLERGVKNIWLRKGGRGSDIFSNAGVITLQASEISIIDSTGAGDAALAGWVAAYFQGMPALDCMQAGHTLAMEVLQVHGAVIPDISFGKLLTLISKYYPDAK